MKTEMKRESKQGDGEQTYLNWRLVRRKMADVGGVLACRAWIFYVDREGDRRALLTRVRTRCSVIVGPFVDGWSRLARMGTLDFRYHWCTIVLRGGSSDPVYSRGKAALTSFKSGMHDGVDPLTITR